MSDSGGPGTYTFVRGATLLAGASLISRLLGGLVRIPLTRLLGGDGVSALTPAYVLFGLAITFAVSGLCVATSRVVAELVAQGDRRQAGRALGAALGLGLVTGIAFWFALDRAAGYLADRLLGDAQQALFPAVCGAVRAIAPAVIPVSLMSALKGYFQGLQDMAPTSEAQVVEQVVRVGAMVWLVLALREQGLVKAVGGAALGNVIGATAALILLLAVLARPSGGRSSAKAGRLRQERHRDFRRPAGGRGVLGRILRVALPVTAGAAILPLMDALQTFMIPGRLQAGGFQPGEAMYLYGQLHFMAYPLASLPAIAATAMAAALVPAITDALERGQETQVRGRTTAAVRLTILLGLPAVAGLVVLATPISQMLYGIPEAGLPLTYVAAACLFISLQQTTSGVLLGLGLPSVPAWGLAAGLVVNTAATHFLTSVPALGINGAALAIVAGFGTAAVVNLAVVGRRTGMRFDGPAMLVRPAVATAALVLAATLIYRWVMSAGGGNTLATLAAVGAGAVGYGVVLLVIGGIQPREVEFIPRVGPKLAALLERIPHLRG